MILVLVVTRAPASLQILAAARSKGPPRLRKIPSGRQRGQERDGTGRNGWSGEVEQQSVEVGRVRGLLAAGDGCECSAGVRAGLGISGSSTTPTSFRLSRHDVVLTSSCMDCTYERGGLSYPKTKDLTPTAWHTAYPKIKDLTPILKTHWHTDVHIIFFRQFLSKMLILP